MDHIHLIFSPSRKLPLSKIIQEVKKSSHKFLKARPEAFPDFQRWQVGYAGFSYHKNQREILINYVKRQKQHHKKVTFKDEYIKLLKEYGVEYCLKYLFE